MPARGAEGTKNQRFLALKFSDLGEVAVRAVARNPSITIAAAVTARVLSIVFAPNGLFALFSRL